MINLYLYIYLYIYFSITFSNNIFTFRDETGQEDGRKNQEELVMHEKQLDVDNEQAVNVSGEMDKQAKFVSDNVVNLSDRVLSVAEISLLSEGLKFCPTPLELDRSPIKRDLKEFSRKIKCKAYFLSGTFNEEGGLGFRQFREKSPWCPSVNELNPVINVYLKQLKARVDEIDERGSNFSNLLSDEQDALKILKSYRDIVIKEADKGGAVVVWGRIVIIVKKLIGNFAIIRCMI